MRDIPKGVITISVFIVVSLFVPIAELHRLVDPDPQDIITGGWSNPIVIFLFGAYSDVSQFQDRYHITESISNASTMPFLLLIVLNILLLFILMIRRTSPKAAFPLSVLIVISWILLTVQTYSAIENWVVRPVLITPLVGSFMTLIFINDLDSLRKLLHFDK
jgi:hypothetical protein